MQPGKLLIRSTLCGALLASQTWGAEDCALGKRYLDLAQDRINAYQTDEAVAFLHQAVETCPSYDSYEKLAELAAQSPQRDDNLKAAEAFVEAEARAPEGKARAQTLYQYAALLNRVGDPQNAYPLIKEAQSLDQSRSDIADLARTVAAQVEHPTQEHIVRALRYSLYQPLKPATHPPSGTRRRGAPVPSAGSGPSVNIQINFDTASIAPDEMTRPNLELLAHALADPSLAGRKFTFVGHSDQRGSDPFNVDLSVRRAKSISESVEAIEPSLKGRILVEGRGAHEPIDPGTSDQALRANRRLQVLAPE